jgi:hypothetical protein
MSWPYPYPQGPWSPYQQPTPPNTVYVPIPLPPMEEPNKKRSRRKYDGESSAAEAFIKQLDDSERMIGALKEKFKPKEGDKKKEGKSSNFGVGEWMMMLFILSPVLWGAQLWLASVAISNMVKALQ